jgi:hypothetical protein
MKKRLKAKDLKIGDKVYIRSRVTGEEEYTSIKEIKRGLIATDNDLLFLKDGLDTNSFGLSRKIWQMYRDKEDYLYFDELDNKKNRVLADIKKMELPNNEKIIDEIFSCFSKDALVNTKSDTSLKTNKIFQCASHNIINNVKDTAVDKLIKIIANLKNKKEIL